jgi:hypothetical protein
MERSRNRYCAFLGPMELTAAWSAQLAGVAIFFTVLAGMSGFPRDQAVAAERAWRAACWQAFVFASAAALHEVLKARLAILPISPRRQRHQP